MQVQPELGCDGLLIQRKAISVHAVLQESEVELVVRTAKDLPGHLERTIRGDLVGPGWSGIAEGDTEGPTAEDVLGRDLSVALEREELVTPLLGDPHGLDRVCGRAHQKYPFSMVVLEVASS
jgi:hypothetical protein